MAEVLNPSGAILLDEGQANWHVIVNDNTRILNDFVAANTLLTATAGEDITAGNAITIRSDGLAYNATNNDWCVGIAAEDAAATETFNVRIAGVIQSNLDATAAIGQPVFTSSIAGQLSGTESTGAHMVGIVVESGKIVIAISR